MIHNLMTMPKMVMVTLVGIISVLSPALVYSQSPDNSEEPRARYDYRRWYYRVKNNQFTLNVSSRVTINNRRGDEFGRLLIGTSSFSKLKKVEARLIDAEGKVISTLDKDDLKKICGYGEYSVYTDRCRHYTALQSNKYPYSVEFKYTIESSSLFFLHGRYFQSDIPVAEAKYTLDLPADQSFKFQMNHLEFEQVSVEGKKRSTYVWKAVDIPPLEDVELTPPGINVPASLNICMEQFVLDDYQFDSLQWKYVGQWYNDLAAEKYASELRIPECPADSARELIKRTYDEVIANVRYVAVQIGIGGWQPYHADLTLDRGWGDCKDMSTLLISNLRERGIRAYPALVLTRSFGPVDTTFPSFGFNHLVATAIVGSDTIWMDPTCNNCPFGDLRSDVEDIDVLLMSDQGGTIVRTPASTPAENKKVRVTQWQVNGDGHASFASALTYYGNFASQYRYRLAGRDSQEKRQLVEDQFRGTGRRLIVSSYKIDQPDSLELPVTFSIEGNTRTKLDRLDRSTYIEAVELTGRADFEELDLRERTLPVDIGYPRTYLDSMVIGVDSVLDLETFILPDTDTIQTSFGHIYFSAEANDSIATLVLEREYYGGRVESDQLEELALIRSRLKEILRTLVAIVHSN